MNKLAILLVSTILFISCKKEENEDISHFLKTIRFTNNSSSFDVTYTIFYNSNKQIERISNKNAKIGSIWNFQYFLKYVDNKLDSIILYDSISLIKIGGVAAEWTNDDMTFFWTSNHIYDDKNRLTSSTSLSGNHFKYEYKGDSSLLFFDEAGANPEYLTQISHRTSALKNPFRIYKNESLFPINNYVFNYINNDFKNGNFFEATDKVTAYKNDGTIQNTSFGKYEGILDGYPLKLSISYNNSSEIRTLEYSYE